MTTTYRLNVNELTDEILQSIKAAFKNRDIEIIVSDEVDETAYLLSTEANRKHLEKSMKDLQEGRGVVFSMNELQEKYGSK